MGIAHTIDGEFHGVMEFFLTNQAKENKDVIAKVKEIIQKK